MTKIRKIYFLAMVMTGILMLIGCGQKPSEENQSLDTDVKEETAMLLIDVNGTTLEAELADNSSSRALADLVGDGEVTLELRDYANMEKVGSLPQSIPTNDERISTDYGDIILYQGNQFVLYYDKNSWSFTRLGHINGISKEELKEILGTGSVTVSLRISK